MTAKHVTARRNWRVWIWLTYWGLLYLVTHLPPGPAGRFMFNLPDWSLHFVMYGALGMLVFWARGPAALESSGGRWSRRAPAFVALWLGVYALYGAFDELTQPYVGRHAEVRDWAWDMAGVALGLLLGYMWLSRRAGRMTGVVDPM